MANIDPRLLRNKDQFPATRPSEVPKLLDTEMVKVFQNAAA
jgi:hypothetical protein